ncbi:MAG: hypothetical protein DSY87_03660 [Methylococcus sp.]|nr:MAG: hypothetical protein DSY87_03660 [Methylococcus sp.]
MAYRTSTVLFPGIGLVLLLATLSGCTSITTTRSDGRQITRSIDQFKGYIESVFRRQNQATLNTGQLLDEDISESTALELESAEHRMLDACGALNQVARKKMNRNKPGILLELKVRNTIGECDHATEQLEQLIEELESSATDSLLGPD